MKKLFLIVAAMFAAVSFSACSDDDDNGHVSDKPVLVKQCIITEEYGETDIVYFEYDSQNRISHISSAERTDGKEEFLFSYNENKMTITYKQTDYTEPDRSYTEIYICEQNTDGYIEKETDPNNDYTTYSYKNGYLQNQQPSYSNQQYTYNWNNGNLVSYSAVGEWTTTITYSQSTATPINLDLNFVNEYRWSYHFWGLLGKKSKNLPQKSVLKHKDSANTLTITYQYELNSNKTISKVLVSEVQTGDHNESRNYSIKFVY